MEISKIESDAQELYDANKEYIGKIINTLSPAAMSAFAKEQDRLHLLICDEQDKRIATP